MSRPAEIEIVVIGAGLSGTLAAIRCLEARPGARITLIEKSGRFGPGVAYGTLEPFHLMNVRAHAASAFPERPDDFVSWLDRHRLEVGAFSRDSFVPRMTYGRYIGELLQRESTGLLRRIHGEAIDAGIDGPDGRPWVKLDDGRLLVAEHVVLALGNSRGGNDASTVLAGARGHAGYVADFWGGFREETPGSRPHASLRDGARVLLLGSGLTMVDALLTILRKGTGKPEAIHVLSRHGCLPLAHIPAGPHGSPPPLTGERATPFDLLRSLRRATREERYPWQAHVDALRADTPGIWASWSERERGRFLRHLRTFWDLHRHRLAPEAASELERARASGLLVSHAGRVVSASCGPKPGSRIQVRYRPRGEETAGERELELDAVIDCMGPWNDFRSPGVPLIARLRARGLLFSDEHGLGVQSVAPWLSVLGPLRRGELWESTAIPEIARQAAALAVGLPLRSSQCHPSHGPVGGLGTLVEPAGKFVAVPPV